MHAVPVPCPVPCPMQRQMSAPINQLLPAVPTPHAVCFPSVDAHTWVVGSPTERCTAGDDCVLKVAVPTGECVHHHGHQCTKCKGWHHNPCVGAVEPDECGRCDEASSGAGLSDGAKVTDPPQVKPTDTGLTAHHVEDGGSESSHAHLKRDSAKPAPVTPQVTSRAAG